MTGAPPGGTAKPAIRIENVSKMYHLGTRSIGRYRTLRDTLAAGAARAWRRTLTMTTGLFRLADAARLGPRNDILWALKEVSFDVQRGEVVGVIGRNGAGKSTLLKILTRITEPTAGRIRYRGRVGSLLEVGAGFHQELTGRENVYLNGVIMGMTRREIARKFDDIVGFAEVEKFLDTPVKHYSSGMFVRLAFAVAAHLEPEILIVDEVLAVGDVTYQRRCVDRIQALASGGTTVVLVSHDIDLVSHLCSRAILLESGKVKMEGPPEAVTENYLARQLAEEYEDLSLKPHSGDGRARFISLRLLTPEGDTRRTHVCGTDLILRMEIASQCEIEEASLAVIITTLTGTRIITGWTNESGANIHLRPGIQAFVCRFRKVFLRPGHHFVVHLWMEAHGLVDHIEHARMVETVHGLDTKHVFSERHQGIVFYDYQWQEVPIDSPPVEAGTQKAVSSRQ